MPLFTQLLKDQDYKKISTRLMQSNEEIVDLGNENSRDIVEILKKDSEFLRSMNIMDYSLYIVVESLSQKSLD